MTEQQQAHLDFIRLINFEDPADALAFVKQLSIERRYALQCYVSIEGERNRRSRKISCFIILLFLILIVAHFVF